MKPINILITGAGGPAVSSMIKIIRSKRKCNIFCVDANKYSSGFFLSDKSYIVPMGSDKNFKIKIKQIIIENKINIIISVVDEELISFSELEKELSIICIQPNKSFIEQTLDKKKCALMLKKINLNHLNTKLLSNFNTKNYSKLNFPVIVKPRFGRGSRGVAKIKSLKEMLSFINKKNIHLSQWILQDYIDGTEYTISVACYKSKKNYSIIPKKIIIKEGITKVACTIENREIDKVCKKIINKLNPSGPFNVQCRVDKFTGKVFIFEINPRFSTSTTLTVAAGFDEINYLIDISLGKLINLNAKKWKQGIYMIRNYTDFFSTELNFE